MRQGYRFEKHLQQLNSVFFVMNSHCFPQEKYHLIINKIEVPLGKGDITSANKANDICVSYSQEVALLAISTQFQELCEINIIRSFQRTQEKHIMKHCRTTIMLWCTEQVFTFRKCKTNFVLSRKSICNYISHFLLRQIALLETRLEHCQQKIVAAWAMLIWRALACLASEEHDQADQCNQMTRINSMSSTLVGRALCCAN